MNGSLYVGIDVGSSAVKCVILDIDGSLVGHHVISSGFDYNEAAKTALSRALLNTDGSRENIKYCISTGYGRKSVEVADKQVTEITCHARGASEWYPQVRNIIDIGGQDTKIIRLNENNRLADYRMNTKCAAGTGTFLESIALKLGISLSQLDELALQSTVYTVINSYCTVFTSTEVIERIKEGQSREDICMGLYRSIAARVMEMMSARDGAVGVTGGVAAHSRALIRALEEVLETDILLPPMPQHAGAYGAALIALESTQTQKKEKNYAS